MVRIGVIHPVESYWLKWGSEETTYADREAMEEKFDSLIKWLLYGLQDFDYIAESLLEELPEGEKGFTAGKMRYDVILVPDCLTLRENTCLLYTSRRLAMGQSGPCRSWETSTDSWPVITLKQKPFILRIF